MSFEALGAGRIKHSDREGKKNIVKENKKIK